MTVDLLRLFSREGVQSIKQKNAVQPIAWVCLVISGPCFYLSTSEAAKGWLPLLLVAVGFVPIMLFVAAYLYFMICDPGRLQSEEYQLANRALEIFDSKSGPLTVSASDLQMIVNPQTDKKLEDRRNG